MSPRALTPFFLAIALVNAAAVATRFDLLAVKLPAGAEVAVMLAVVPLLVLAGYFEGRLDYGPQLADLPLWMRIRLAPVKLAFTFGFIYLACVALQTWKVSIGPLDPYPPATFPPLTRAMWFGIFTAGMFFPFYLAATSALIPLLRFLTRPLRALPSVAGSLAALVLGGGLGLLVMSAVTSMALGAFIKTIRDSLDVNPAVSMVVTLGMTLGPLALGLVLERDD